MNFIDKAIDFISPEAGAKRARARIISKLYGDQFRKYEAAQRGRRTAGLPRVDGSANTETRIDLVALRAGSRDMGRNNPYAKKAIQSITANTVGTGIQPSVQVTGRSKAKIAAIKKAWKEWAESKDCDFDGQKNIYGIQRLAMRTIAEAGEVLILKRRAKTKSKIPIQLQILEPDYLDHSKDSKNFSRDGAGGGYITQGVEYNKQGKRVGYWIYKNHPGEYGNYGASEFVSADNVIHIYEVLRPGQVRGVPFGSSAMLRLKDYDDYEDAEVVRQKIAACFVAFVQDADPGLGGGGSSDAMVEKLEPGVIEHLPPGKTVNFATPPTTSNYESFSRKILQGISAGYGTTYEAISGDLSKVNFSSGRMGWLEMQRQIAIWQYDMLIPMMCDTVWDWFMDGAEVGALFNSVGVSVSWTPPRREMIDPVKETAAIIKQVRAGLKSYSEAVRELGYEPTEVIAELIEDFKMINEGKLTLDIDGKIPENQQPAQAK